MRVYGDTSWWLSLKCRGDVFHERACLDYEQLEDGEFLWTSWNAVETFNCFRQMEYRKIIAHGESAKLVKMMEQERYLGYWVPAEVPWELAVGRANELSAQYGCKSSIRGMDLFHVAVAIEVGADKFLSFNADQMKLARAVGFC